MNKVIVDETFHELKQHGSFSFPFKVYQVHLSEYDGMRFPAHWHDEFEFLLIREGQMQCVINGEAMRLETGEGLFINSDTVHTGAAVNQADCSYYGVTLHPQFFGERAMAISQTYVTPFCDTPFLPFYKITSDALLTKLRTVCELSASQDLERNINIYIAVLLLWKELFLACKDSFGIDLRSRDSGQVHEMISFIKEHYNQGITLDQIAASAGISKSGCNHLFKKYMKESPLRFLLRYRVEKGCRLLASTSMTVTEISAEVGLCTSSYFCETFKKIKGITPSEYRRINLA